MGLVVNNEMTKEQRIAFLRMLRWEELRYDNSHGYHHIMDITGCREYIYGEDPDKYLNLVVECYNKYCEVYPEEADARQKRRELDMKAVSEGMEKFLEMASKKFAAVNEIGDDMDEVRAEALERNAQWTIAHRKKEFRRICEEQDLGFFK